jgi:hypothetical protein
MGMIANEFHDAEVQAIKLHSVIHTLSEGIGWIRSRENGLGFSPGVPSSGRFDPFGMTIPDRLRAKSRDSFGANPWTLL